MCSVLTHRHTINTHDKLGGHLCPKCHWPLTALNPAYRTTGELRFEVSKKKKKKGPMGETSQSAVLGLRAVLNTSTVRVRPAPRLASAGPSVRHASAPNSRAIAVVILFRFMLCVSLTASLGIPKIVVRFVSFRFNFAPCFCKAGRDRAVC